MSPNMIANLLIKFSIGSSLTEIWPNEAVMLPIIMGHLVRSRDTSKWKNESLQTFRWHTSPLLLGYGGGMSGPLEALALTMNLPPHWVGRVPSLGVQGMMRHCER